MVAVPIDLLIPLLRIPVEAAEMTMKGFRKNAVRNRAIKASFEAGRTVEDLASEHRLSAGRIKALILDEENRMKTSADSYYRELRAKAQEQLN